LLGQPIRFTLAQSNLVQPRPFAALLLAPLEPFAPWLVSRARNKARRFIEPARAIEIDYALGGIKKGNNYNIERIQWE